MSDYFLAGTLRHLPLLAIVLGSAPDALAERVGAAVLPGMSACLGADGAAVLHAAPDRSADGLLLRGVSAQEEARLVFFAAGHRQSPACVHPAGEAPAQAFFSDHADAPDTDPDPRPFDLLHWRQHWSEGEMAAATQIMMFAGTWPACDVAVRAHMARFRAFSRLRAAARPGRDLRGDITVDQWATPYANFFAVSELDLRHRQYDGATSARLNRAALMSGDAAVVLCYDPLRDEVLLTEQFRPAVYISGYRDPWVTEPVAGLVDPGETPQQAALREAFEEGGVTPRRLEPAGGAYSSTGSSTEFIHLYVGICDLSQVGAHGGLDAEQEDIALHCETFDTLVARAEAGQIIDLPLVALTYWLARHRDRLRGQGRDQGHRPPAPRAG